jgi:hypothetical protein
MPRMYGSFHRDLVPVGTTESGGVKAAHKHRIFEVRVPTVVEAPAPSANIPVGKG